MTRATGSRVLLAATLALLALPAAAPAARAAVPAAGDTLPLTLDDAVERAVASGEEVRLARAFVQQTEGRVREALSQAMPQINSNVNYNRQLASIFSSLGSSTDTTFSDLSKLFENSPFAAQNTWTAEVTGQQLLWSGGKVGSAFKAARAANREAHASAAETASDVTYQVRRAYYDAAYAYRLVDIAEGGLALAQEHLRLVESGRREGSRSEFDVLRAQVDAANQEPAVVSARRGVDLALLALKRLVNLPLEQPVGLATPISFEEEQVPVVVADTFSVAQRPALTAAEAEVEARRYAVNVYKGQRWPDFYLNSTFQEQAFPRDVFPRVGSFERNWSVSVKMTLPIFTGFRTEGQVQQAQADLATARANRDRLREQVAIEATQARADLARSLTTLSARRQAVAQARRAFELARVRFTNGMSAQVEVSDARLQFQTAEVNEISATRDYLVALASLERAVGHPLPVQRMSLEDATHTLETEGKR